MRRKKRLTNRQLIGLNLVLSFFVATATFSVYSIFSFDESIKDFVKADIVKEEMPTEEQEEVILQKEIDRGIQRYIQSMEEKRVSDQKEAYQREQAKRNNVPKSEKPNIELFVMSHCPYGTQIEKGFLPVIDLLGDKIDFNIKFVDYAMHDLKEINEEINQYCLMEQYPDKFLRYLKCFLSASNSNACLAELGLSIVDLENCSSSIDEKFNITENYNDRQMWHGSYPSFDIYKEDNMKYNVQGSPTLIINGQEMMTQRDPNSLLKTVCLAFSEVPVECKETLSSDPPSPGFGFGETTTQDSVDCAG